MTEQMQLSLTQVMSSRAAAAVLVGILL